MKILFLSTKNLNAQGDYLELTIIHGMRELLNKNFIEYPRKDIMYGDFTKSPKSELHGRGFSLLRNPIEDVDRKDVFNQKYDAIIYGSGHIVGEEVYIDEIDNLANNNVWILDGHDLYGNAPIKKKYKNEEFQKILSWILTIQIKLNSIKSHIQNLLNLKIQLILVAAKLIIYIVMKMNILKTFQNLGLV